MRGSRGFVLACMERRTRDFVRASAMWKAIVAGTAALAIAGTSLVYAQQQRGGRDFGQRWQPNTEDLRAFGEARPRADTRAGKELAGLRAGGARLRQAADGPHGRDAQRPARCRSGRAPAT